MSGWANETRGQTCFASTAWVNSGENATCVIETSSRTTLNRNALLVKFSRTSRETYEDDPDSVSKRGGSLIRHSTISRCVISWLALNWATTLFRTSFTIDGSTRSS